MLVYLDMEKLVPTVTKKMRILGHFENSVLAHRRSAWRCYGLALRNDNSFLRVQPSLH